MNVEVEVEVKVEVEVEVEVEVKVKGIESRSTYRRIQVNRYLLP